jgi:predicted dehydrogenase
MAHQQTRRDFLRSAAALTGTALGARTLTAPRVLGAAAPSRTLGVAVIGVGGMGGYSVSAATRERVVALCDIDEGNLAKAMKQVQARDEKGPAPKVFHDYRRMLDACHKDLDVVLIATPDHHHAPAAIRAIERGKATFCQKPLAHNLAECRRLAEAARKNKVLTQMGNQGHCGEGYRRLRSSRRATC